MSVGDLFRKFIALFEQDPDPYRPVRRLRTGTLQIRLLPFVKSTRVTRTLKKPLHVHSSGLTLKNFKGVRALSPSVVEYLVVHCADTTEHQACNAMIIHEWHSNQGWAGIGYHFVIDRDGRIESGRPMELQGAHEIKVNSSSLAICLAGGRAANGSPVCNFTQEQMDSLYNLLYHLQQRHPKSKVVGHRDVRDPSAPKACPCFDAADWYRNYPTGIKYPLRGLGRR